VNAVCIGLIQSEQIERGARARFPTFPRPGPRSHGEGVPWAVLAAPKRPAMSSRSSAARPLPTSPASPSTSTAASRPSYSCGPSVAARTCAPWLRVPNERRAKPRRGRIRGQSRGNYAPSSPSWARPPAGTLRTSLPTSWCASRPAARSPPSRCRTTASRSQGVPGRSTGGTRRPAGAVLREHALTYPSNELPLNRHRISTAAVSVER
jgi:hypothetical protein